MSVLLLDQDDAFIGYTQELLERNGFSVAVARTAEEARIKSSTKEYEIILAELLIEDALTFLEEIKTKQPTIALMIVTTKALTRPEHKQVFHLNADVVKKPFFPHEFLERIHYLLGVRYA